MTVLQLELCHHVTPALHATMVAQLTAHICLLFLQRNSEELEWFDIPVSELNLEQLQLLKVEHGV